MRRTAHCLIGLILLCAAALLTACGSTTTSNTTSLATSLEPADPEAQVKPGDSPEYIVRVVNGGASLVTGVTVHVDLPANFTFKSTTSISGTKPARTHIDEASLLSRNPAWGTWSLQGPETLADGTLRRGELDIRFTVDAQGAPGNYQMAGRATADSADGVAEAKGLPVTVAAAPHLSFEISATPGTIRAGGIVTYKASITNDGTGPAEGVNILITLPQSFQWTDTAGTAGNSSKQGVREPIKGSSLVDYGGYTIPPRSDAGPGVLSISFHVSAVLGTPVGSYPVSAELTADGGLDLVKRNTVPIAVVT